MKRKILVVGLACLSAVAVAQSSGDQSSEKKKSNDAATHQVQARRDQATGMASGKREAAQPVKTGAKARAGDDWDVAKGKGAKTSAASWDLATAKSERTAAPKRSGTSHAHVPVG